MSTMLQDRAEFGPSHLFTHTPVPHLGNPHHLPLWVMASELAYFIYNILQFHLQYHKWKNFSFSEHTEPPNRVNTFNMLKERKSIMYKCQTNSYQHRRAEGTQFSMFFLWKLLASNSSDDLKGHSDSTMGQHWMHWSSWEANWMKGFKGYMTTTLIIQA